MPEHILNANDVLLIESIIALAQSKGVFHVKNMTAIGTLFDKVTKIADDIRAAQAEQAQKQDNLPTIAESEIEEEENPSGFY